MSYCFHWATKKAQTAPGHGPRHHTWQISPSESLKSWYKHQLLDKLKELNPVKSRQLQRAKVTTIIRASRNLGFDPEGPHVLSERNTQQRQQQQPQQPQELTSQQQHSQNENDSLQQEESDSETELLVVEEVTGDRPGARKHVRLTEDEGDDLEAPIEKTVKRLVLDVIQAVLIGQNQPATVSTNENSDVSATSWSDTIRASVPAQTQLVNQSSAPTSLSREGEGEGDRLHGLSEIGMPDFVGQTNQLLQSAHPVVPSTASFLNRNSFASLPGNRLADNVDGQNRGEGQFLTFVQIAWLLGNC